MRDVTVGVALAMAFVFNARAADVWVDCDNGNDLLGGLSSTTPYRTLAAAQSNIRAQLVHLGGSFSTPTNVWIVGTCYPMAVNSTQVQMWCRDHFRPFPSKVTLVFLLTKVDFSVGSVLHFDGAKDSGSAQGPITWQVPLKQNLPTIFVN